MSLRGVELAEIPEETARVGCAVFDAVLRDAGTPGRRDAGATRDLNRLEFVVETLRAALNQIAEAVGGLAWPVRHPSGHPHG
ncbi:hypothetical protein ACFY5C_40395 [Streptomyces sp. NPDC012935]|uniref:hypothetical protein n=1 Tax=Streptomyces sp. NPDC012935 TaxID=3364857 RepID=UPI00369AFD97